MPLPEVVESIVLPSKVIAQGFAAVEIENTDGETFVGRIEREDATDIVIWPAGAPNSVTIPKRKIHNRKVSPLSNMPTGMLNTMEQAAVLDLLAYLVSDGDSEHSAFRSASKSSSN